MKEFDRIQLSCLADIILCQHVLSWFTGCLLISLRCDYRNRTRGLALPVAAQTRPVVSADFPDGNGTMGCAAALLQAALRWCSQSCSHQEDALFLQYWWSYPGCESTGDKIKHTLKFTKHINGAQLGGVFTWPRGSSSEQDLCWYRILLHLWQTRISRLSSEEATRKKNTKKHTLVTDNQLCSVWQGKEENLRLYWISDCTWVRTRLQTNSASAGCWKPD